MSLKKLAALYSKSNKLKPDNSSEGCVLLIGNSFTKLFGATQKASDEIRAALTYTNEEVKQQRSALLRKMAYAKKRQNRKMLFGAKKQFDDLASQEVVCWFDESKVTPEFPTGLLSLVERILKSLNEPYSLKDLRIKPAPTLTLRWKNQPPRMRYYQAEMVDLALSKHRGVFESAVGSGKSRIITQIIKELEVVTLVVLPSSTLVQQTLRVLTLAFGKKHVEQVTTDKVKNGKRLGNIRLCTIQTLASLQKQGIHNKLVQDVQLLVCDEIHHSGSKSYTNILSDLDHVFYRFGFTGTFLRNDSKTMDMHGFLSEKLYSYPAYKATIEGFLTPVQFHIHQLPGKSSKKYQTEYSNNYGDNEPFLEEISKIIFNAASTEQILILVDRKATVGSVIHDYLNSQGIDSTYVSGDHSKDIISEAIAEFNEKHIRILIASTVLGEGIDLFSTDRLILARGGKSEIAIVQAIGRAVRLAEGKKKALVHDFNFYGTNFLAKHSKIRESIYQNTFGGDVKVYEKL
jgi:superfamily II DNA or RNA helicase